MSQPQAKWMGACLKIAAVYNLVWGAWVVLFPTMAFEFAGLEPPRYPQIWQCLGMVVGVYGLAYWWAARDVARHWPVVAAGLVGKVLGPIGMIEAIASGALPAEAAWVCVGNDVIWWVPFGLMLWHARRVGVARAKSITDRADRDG